MVMSVLFVVMRLLFVVISLPHLVVLSVPYSDEPTFCGDESLPASILDS